MISGIFGRFGKAGAQLFLHVVELGRVAAGHGPLEPLGPAFEQILGHQPTGESGRSHDHDIVGALSVHRSTPYRDPSAASLKT